MRDTFSYDTYNAVVGVTDDVFMLLYKHVRRNARRITHLVITLVPLLALLVGSCKTAQTTAFAEARDFGPERFRMALFPDRPHFAGTHYTPAAGYISEARDYVEARPQAMLMLTREEIGYIFGKPSLQRRDADAQIWQYKTGACVVNFYFYGKNTTSYVDIRIKDSDDAFRTEPPSPQEVSKCLRHIDAEDFRSAAL